MSCLECKEYQGESMCPKILKCPRGPYSHKKVESTKTVHPKRVKQQLKREIRALVELFPCDIKVPGCHTALVGLVAKLRELSRD